MELLAPAGNFEKLTYAYGYGADAVYIGLDRFSLRSRADNFSTDDALKIEKIKGTKKLYCALNIYFHPEDISTLENSLESVGAFPFDAFIVSDLGIVPFLRRHFPRHKLHLSTQANCVNGEAAKIYRDLGFTRIILGRECSLKDIESIRMTVPDIELEGFAHGAMCLAYSGRCFLSAYMTGRSGNSGDCAHACRWNYRLLEEAERPGEFYPVIEDDGFTTILSSKDLCMIDYIRELHQAGLHSLKIEGRMKSLYYTAVVTRGYRKMIDAVVYKNKVQDLAAYRQELFHISHREYSTGFYFDRSDIAIPTTDSYIRSYLLLGTISAESGKNRYRLNVKNSIHIGDTIEYIGPDIVSIVDDQFKLFDVDGNPADAAHHSSTFFIETEKPVAAGFIIRKKI